MERTDRVDLRQATMNDAQDCFEWRNHPENRKFFFHSEPTTLEARTKWLQESLSDPNRTLWIILNELGRSIGELRFDRSAEDRALAKISIILRYTEQGKGYGPEAIKFGTQRYFDLTDVSSIAADIIKGNQGSFSAFRKAGYSDYRDHGSYMELRRER